MERLTGVTLNDIEASIRQLKKVLNRDGTRRELELRSYPKPSERKKIKRLKATIRRKKPERKTDGHSWDIPNERLPAWRFVHTDGKYLKVPVKRGEMHQI